MITLENLYIEEKDNLVYLKSTCFIDDQKHILWYSTKLENKKYISTSNADSFLLFIFIYAIFENKKIYSKIPISAELSYGLLEIMLPSFQQMGFSSKKENFQFSKIDKSFFPEAQSTGTAMSFGVDSFYTFFKSQESIKKVDVLTLFNAGAFGQYGGDKARLLFNQMKNKVWDFSAKMNLNFVWIDTNLNEIFKLSFVKTHTFRNFSCALVLPKLFKNYLYASGTSIQNFELNQNDTMFYDLLISKAIKNNSSNFFISGLNENRFDKTLFISNQKIAQDLLNVCLITPDNPLVKTNENCSQCSKCIRTMISLDIIGKLDKFNFDINLFKKHKNKFLAELLYQKLHMKDPFAKEIFSKMKDYNYKLPAQVYIELIKKVKNTLVRKIKK